jgi:hypothetical protein
MWKKGMKAVCVDTGGWAELKLNEIYEVDFVITCCSVWLGLIGVPKGRPTGPECPYCGDMQGISSEKDAYSARMFRPVQEDKLMQQLDEIEKAPLEPERHGQPVT